MAEQHCAQTYIDAECRRLKAPLGSILEQRLVLVAYVEAKLRTCKEEEAGCAAKSYTIAKVDWDVDRLILNLALNR